MKNTILLVTLFIVTLSEGKTWVGGTHGRGPSAQELSQYHDIPIICNNADVCKDDCIDRCNVPLVHYAGEPECLLNNCYCRLKGSFEEDEVHQECSDDDQCQLHCNARCNRRPFQYSTGYCLEDKDGDKNVGYCFCQILDGNYIRLPELSGH